MLKSFLCLVYVLTVSEIYAQCGSGGCQPRSYQSYNSRQSSYTQSMSQCGGVDYHDPIDMFPDYPGASSRDGWWTSEEDRDQFFEYVDAYRNKYKRDLPWVSGAYPTRENPGRVIEQRYWQQEDISFRKPMRPNRRLQNRGTFYK